MSLVFLHCLARAVVKNAAGTLLKCLPFGEALYDIARDALEEWKSRQHSPTERRREVEQLGQADADRIHQEASSAASDAPPEMRKQLAQYLECVPGTIRRSLSRLEDPTGRTVPAMLPLDRAEDVVPFLPSRPPRFQPGDHPRGVKGWVLQERLGSGGFGEVSRAEDENGREAALKFCLDAASEDTLRNEKKLLDLLKQIQKENYGASGFVGLLDAYLDADPPCLVFEYIPGGDLTRLIRCWHEPKPSPERLVWETMRLISRLAQTVSVTHQLTPKAIVHRDLKPSNILLKPSGVNHVKLRVTDFGIGDIVSQQGIASARIASRKEILSTSLRGAHSDLYASQQQKEGKDADPSDDIYALGVIGCQVLLGDTTRGWTPSVPKDLKKAQVPESVIDLLENCLMDESEDRLPNGTALFQAVNELFLVLCRPSGQDLMD